MNVPNEHTGVQHAGRSLPVNRAAGPGTPKHLIAAIGSKPGRGGASPLPQHEEPVLGEHGQDRRERVVEEVEPGDKGPRIAEPRRQRVGGVARDDVVAAAFDDRETWRQEPSQICSVRFAFWP
jgi:hypothetical protein